MKFGNLVSKFWKRVSKDEVEMPYSIVLLLREAHFFSKTELEVAGEKGWSKRFGSAGEPMYFVVQKDRITMMKAGMYVVHVLQAERPYLEDVEVVLKQLPRPEQKEAWLQHRPWVALDLWNSNLSYKASYAVLARFALHLGDKNCAAVWLPKTNMMLPNDGTAEEGLRMMIRDYPLSDKES